MLFTGLLVGIFAFLTGAMSFPNLRPAASNLGLMTLFYGVGSVLMFQSLKLTEASRFTIIFSTRVLFTILASSLLLREGLSGKQFGGTLLILAGVVLVSLKSSRLQFGKGDTLALLTAMFFGLEVTNDRYLLQIVNFHPLLVLEFILPALLIIFFNPRVVKRVFEMFARKRLLLSLSLFSLVYGVAVVTFFAALKTSDNSSQVVSVNLSSVILTVLLAVVFLREREDLFKKLAAVLLSFIGLRLLIG